MIIRTDDFQGHLNLRARLLAQAAAKHFKQAGRTEPCDEELMEYVRGINVKDSRASRDLSAEYKLWYGEQGEDTDGVIMATLARDDNAYNEFVERESGNPRNPAAQIFRARFSELMSSDS